MSVPPGSSRIPRFLALMLVIAGLAGAGFVVWQGIRESLSRSAAQAERARMLASKLEGEWLSQERRLWFFADGRLVVTVSSWRGLRTQRYFWQAVQVDQHFAVLRLTPVPGESASERLWRIDFSSPNQARISEEGTQEPPADYHRRTGEEPS